jgi:hypothetical protein
MSVTSGPYKKGKGFVPNPVAKHGIPRFADSRYNKNVIGTPDWEKYWEEQLYYIHHGYQTGGMFIPGRYYYYANFKIFDTVLGPRHADICDLHLELAYVIEHCKKEGKNFIGPKKRRGGLSEAFNNMVIDYGARFIPGYNAGVAAGLSTYTEEFMKKWSVHNNIIVPELRCRTKGTEEITFCYDVIDDNGKREEGTFNKIHVATMFQNANLFKGLFLNDVVAEEGVEFKKLKAFYNATKACLMFGSVQKGNFWTWATGGNRSSNGEDFEEMWYNYESYNMYRFFIKGTRFYHPFYAGATDDRGENVEQVPNLIKVYQPYEMLGIEDEVAAEQNILAKRQHLLDTGDIEGWIEECQNNPLHIDEVFKKSSSNKFNIEILNNVGFQLASNPKGYVKYKLDYVLNANKEKVMPLKVEARPAKDTDLDKDCVLIAIDGLPCEGVPNLYAAGLDSYDQDQSKTSKSLGAMLVMIRNHGLANQPKMKPVCVVRNRPTDKRDFYDICLKVAVFYNITNGVLVDVAKPMVIEHFKSNGGNRFLARRPKKFESVNSEQMHEYGVSLNKYSRPLMVAAMQSYVVDHCSNIVFPKLIDELKGYDEYTTDSDNDLADALGIALMQDISNSIDPRDNSLKDRNKKFLLNDDLDFNPPKLKSLEQDHDGFGSR